MMHRTDQSSGQEGVALFYALLVTLVVSGIVAVVFATSLSEQRQSAFELDFEDTVHVAESGAEIFLQRLAEDPATNSGIDGPAPGDDVAEWALAAATRQTNGVDFDLPVVDVGEGEAVAIRPIGNDAEFVYGVGFTPSRDAWVNGAGAPYARVVRVQVAFSPTEFVGDHALLAGGNATLSGSFAIGGSKDTVHTNGGIAVDGTGGTVGQITYSGTCTKGCDKDFVADGPSESVPIEEADLLDVYTTDDAFLIAFDQDWYDYCSGQWYLRGRTDREPCKGTPVAAPAGWSGTQYVNNSGSPSNDVFYFAGDVDVEVKKVQGSITVITGGDITVGASSNLPAFDARYPGLLFLAGGDISIGGNADGFAPSGPAVVFANGTIELSGTMDFAEMSFVARDGLNAGTTYKGGGSGSLVYNGGAATNFGGDGYPIVVRWDEVFAP